MLFKVHSVGRLVIRMIIIRGMCRIGILENYSLFSSGIRPVLDKIEEFEIICEAKKADDFLKLIRKCKPNVIIVDVIHCENGCVDQLSRIRKRIPKVPVLLVVNTDYSDSFEDFIAMGINGIVFNTSETVELVEAIKTLSRGEDHFPSKVWMLLKKYLRTKNKDIQTTRDRGIELSSREIDILKLFCQGLTYKEIGNSLHISPRTVETHKRNIYSKINVKSTAELIEFAILNKLNS